MPPKPLRVTPAPAQPGLDFEQELWQRGLFPVVGLDEAGRGAWAGPVFAGAVVLPAAADISTLLAGVDDSKQLTPAQRELCAVLIQTHAAACGVGQSSVEEINELGILPATRLAMTRSVAGLALRPAHALVDFVHLPELDLPQTAITHGDAVSLSIAAASILAKTARDAFMRELDTLYPGYEFSRHKGYGTALHQACLREKGPSPAHRVHYRPIASLAPAAPAESPGAPVLSS
jgi:ribonuclease HII